MKTEIAYKTKRTDATFAEYFDHKVSRALQAMVDGLLASEQQSEFKVAMSTYGTFSDTLCFGCAATCAVLQTGGWENVLEVVKQCGGYSIHSCGAEEILLQDLNAFERTINGARVGYLQDLLDYMGCNKPEQYRAVLTLTIDWCLDDDNWREELPKVVQFIAQLEELGY